MKKLKKIRGQKRLNKKIESWREYSLFPNMDLIRDNHYDYVKIWVSPFSNLRYKKRNYTGPKSENRLLILNSLLDIYENWDLELKKLNIPYYLRIWLYEPRFTNSQVVCGIEDRIEHYENVLLLVEEKSAFPHDRYKKLANRIDQWNWSLGIDEEIIENEFCPKEQYESENDYYADQRMFSQLEKRQIRKEDFSDDTERLIRYYVPKGHILIGNKK